MTLDPVQRYFYGLNFENTFLRKEGLEFQSFFSAIMERAHPDDSQRGRPAQKTKGTGAITPPLLLK